MKNKQTGRMIYLPRVVLEEMMDIKREDNIQSNSEAFRKMTQYTRVGREANRIMNFDWSKKSMLPEISFKKFKRKL